MPTDIALYRHHPARNFALRGLAWSLGLFGLLRLSWFETHALLPLTQFQAQIAQRGFGAPAVPVDVTLACSGADALALCAGAILAYPATRSSRLAGATGGIGLILVLNTVRIGTLGRAAASPSMFEVLHIYLWPALLMLAIAGYVFAWMRVSDERDVAGRAGSGETRPDADRGVTMPLSRVSGGSAPASWPTMGLTRRFVMVTAVFLVIFTAAAPLYLESPGVLALGTFVARGAARVLPWLGVEAVARGNILSTAQAAFLVTQECISTPLIPVYLAAIVAYVHTWRWRALALVAAVPLFVGLGIARLLVVALPAALVSSPVFLIHAFYQLLLALVLVCLASVWRHGAGSTAWRRAIIGGAAGAVVAYLLGLPYAGALTSVVAPGVPLEDSQGAVALLPSFQVGLYVALFVAACTTVRWRPFVIGLALLGLSQVVILAALQAVMSYADFVPHARDVRAWAVAAPLLLVVVMVHYDRPRP